MPGPDGTLHANATVLGESSFITRKLRSFYARSACPVMRAVSGNSASRKRTLGEPEGKSLLRTVGYSPDLILNAQCLVALSHARCCGDLSRSDCRISGRRAPSSASVVACDS